VFGQELERAERQAEERIRQRILAIPSSRRYMQRVGEVEIEVIDAAAVAGGDSGHLLKQQIPTGAES
jgi:hypothetical protein